MRPLTTPGDRLNETCVPLSSAARALGFMLCYTAENQTEPSSGRGGAGRRASRGRRGPGQPVVLVRAAVFLGVLSSRGRSDL